MRFAEPQFLVVGAIAVALLLGLRVRAERLTVRALKRLSGARLLGTSSLPSGFRRWLRVGLSCVAVAGAFVALARPQMGKEWRTLDRKGTDLLLLIDTSKSMNADDVRPTRLERTKLAVSDLVARFPEDRIGLLAFAGDAYVESPMTLDHGALLESLGSFDTSLIARPGTDLGRAIDTGAAALKAESGAQKLMVLLTDGEDLEGRALAAAQRAAEAGIVIHAVGVGTPAGELVPATDERGRTIGVVRDDAGEPVRSRLDEPGLRAIAQATHGSYRPLGADGGGLERLYAESLAPLSKVQKGAKLERVYTERFALPLSIALLALVGDALLGFRRRSRRTPSIRGAAGSNWLRAGALGALSLVLLLPGAAEASVRSAEEAYKAKHFEQSAKEYAAEHEKHPDDPRLAIDAGAAAYRAGHFDAAEAALQKALELAEPKLQERVLYDLGDARYRLGATTLKAAPEKTIERWKAAVSSYEGALKLTPNDADARFNRDFVKKKLAELEQQEQQKHQSQPQPQPKNQDKAKPGQGQPQDKSQDKSKSGQGQSQDKSQDEAKPGQAQTPNQDQPPKPGQGEPQSKSEKPGDKKAGTGAEPKPDAPQPKPDQAQPPASARPSGKSPSGAESGGGATPGDLSARDARALLDSLRGDERQFRFGNANPPAGADAPQKDW